MKILRMTNVLAVILGISWCAVEIRAEVAIIAHPSVTVGAASEEEITAIFLGKTDNLQDGLKVLPVDQKDDQAPHAEFYKKVVKKDVDQLDAYWARLIFTGKGEPPKKLAGDAEVLAMVAANPNIIGYVDAASVTPAVKVLLKMP